MIEMEVKELWILLELVKEFREKGDTLDKEAEGDIDPIGKTKIKSKANIYKEVAEKLEKVLKKITRVEES